MAVPLRACPVCCVSDAEHHLLLHVITADGVSHAVPALWFMNRCARLERAGVLPIDAIRGAYLAWAATCTRVGAS